VPRHFGTTARRPFEELRKPIEATQPTNSSYRDTRTRDGRQPPSLSTQATTLYLTAPSTARATHLDDAHLTPPPATEPWRVKAPDIRYTTTFTCAASPPTHRQHALQHQPRHIDYFTWTRVAVRISYVFAAVTTTNLSCYKSPYH